jgi:hypothetical protein
MMNKAFFVMFFSLAVLFAAGSAFAQEATISEWGYGLETSSGVTSGNGLFSTYSFSIQGIHDTGLGFSVDYIKGVDPENESGLAVNSGLLGSLFLGLPLSKFFIPYVGGGLGFNFGGMNDDISLAWKVDGGVTSWLTRILYVKAGVSYDNIREGLGVSVGVGFKLEKSVSAAYRNSDGSTFRRYFSKYLWQNNSTPNSIYGDQFESSEVVRTYQETTSESVYQRAQYEVKTSGGETSTTEIRGRLGEGVIATATTTTPIKSERVKTADAKTTTYYYVYNVTVTRNWYTRTWYYKDNAPTTQRVYQDVESAVLVNSFSETR